MAAAWRPGVQAVVTEVIQTEGVPGLVVAVAHSDEAPEHLVVGADGAGHPLAADSLFPVASGTKLVTALAVLRLADAGRLTIDDSLERHVPEAAAAQPGVTLRRLLTHTSGLHGDYAEALAPRTTALTWSTIAHAALQAPLHQPPGQRVDYSDLNYYLLAIVIERVTGQSFAAGLRDLVLAPLGIEGYLGVEPPRPPAYIAGLPVDQFTGTGLESFNTPFWRSIPRPSGSLVTTTVGLIELLRAFRVRPGGFLTPALASEATRDQTGGLGGGVPGWFDVDPCPWGLGPALQGTFPWAPPTASVLSYGHTGFTSMLAWCDPAANVAWAIFGTRFGFDGWCDRAYPLIGAAVLDAAR